MHRSEFIKFAVFVPITHAEKVRRAVGDTGGSRTSKYSHCSFSTKGIGRFKPETGARPAIGRVGRIESVREERIEFVCRKSGIKKVLAAVRRVHPYEEIAYDIYPLLEI